MGLDLTLIFQTNPNSKCFHSTDKLSFTRNYDLFDKIQKIKAEPIPTEIIFYYGDAKTKIDSYGDALKYIKAGDLAKVEYIDEPWNDFFLAYNKAILEFVRALPPETMIVLYWH